MARESIPTLFSSPQFITATYKLVGLKVGLYVSSYSGMVTAVGPLRERHNA